jgi:hypothetical protein
MQCTRDSLPNIAHVLFIEPVWKFDTLRITNCSEGEMKKADHHLNFAIWGFVSGEATGHWGILALCFMAILLAVVIVTMAK